MRGPRRPLMLRTRVALAVAIAVALGMLSMAAVAYVAVRHVLRQQVNTTLVRQGRITLHRARLHGGQVTSARISGISSSEVYIQVTTSAGQVTYSTPPLRLPVTRATTQVAAGRRIGYFADDTLHGVHIRVLTEPFTAGSALQLATSLQGVDNELARIRVILAVIVAVGVALVAAVVSRVVARAALVPVARLTTAAERVADTRDLALRVDPGRPDELGRLAASFNQMLEALGEAVSAQRQLVADASHELRTPLTSLRTNVELLADNPSIGDEERQEVLRRVVSQVEELGRLVTDITELARGESRGRAPAAVRLDEVVELALARARRDWPAVTFSSELDTVMVLGDADRLQRSVRNLLDNAAKFSPPGGTVEVRLAGGELTVADRGPGISPADLPHVFDRFYRASTARGLPGSGLGLAIVRQVVAHHGGEVHAEARPGGGTLVRVRLPAVAGRPRARAGARGE